MLMPIQPIHIISPTSDIAVRAAAIARDMGLDDKITCHVANLKEGLDLARHLEVQGAEVFIARRGTAEMIKRNLVTPLVHIMVTLEDMVQALGKARRLTGLDRPVIGFFALPALNDELVMFADLLDFELKIYYLVEEEERLALSLDAAIADGVNVIVAGGVVTMLAQQRGFPSVVLDSGAVSLRAAIDEAKVIAYARTLEKSQIERFKAIVDNSGDGVLLLDESACLQMANPAALRILGRDFLSAGMPVTDILPDINLTACYSGVTSRNTVINTQCGTLLVNIFPIKVSDSICGAILFFVPTESITELGAVIHKNKHARGFVSQYDFDDIIGVSPQILTAKAQAIDYAQRKAPVLLVGETGTGKELFAHAIHRASPVGQGPFVTINCAALPPTLLESELFGYEEGSFTGAARKGRPGLFELAHQGSIFLDEISELDMYTQIRLLRVLQNQTTMRIGGNKMIPLSIRIIAATNRNLWDMVVRGVFRKDLFFRLNVLSLFIPPLRGRVGDVSCLARYALSRLSPDEGRRLKKTVLNRLERHTWPGNIRELLNVMERFYVDVGSINSLGMEKIIKPELEWQIMDTISNIQDVKTFSDREHILRTLEENGWHQTRTAKQLGMDRSTLYRKMYIYNLHALKK
jgi:transcriptional regulator with PAS, ATPase and Fis domain